MTLSTEKKHNLKVRIMFYSVNSWRTQAQDTASQITLTDCPREVREEPGYIGLFTTKTR